MEIHSVRIEHGSVQTPTMSYSQRQPQNHRRKACSDQMDDQIYGHHLPNHSQATTDIYKPSRSPLSTAARYPYPASPQLPQAPPQPTISQVQVSTQRYAPGAAAVYTGGYRDYRPQRISLLHPEYASGRARETLPGGAGVVHLDSGVAQGQQPIKKIRLQEQKDNIQPLRIDTREQPGTYNPQVEAISPTLPDHLQQEEQTFRTTKDELIQQIGKVDREIAKAESQIAILKKKEKDLEEIANKPSVKTEVEEDAQPKHQSLPQKIYAENRKKAQSAHAKLDWLGPKVEWPLYNQPSDTAVYHENKRKHMAFKKRLLEYFKRRHAEKDTRNAYLTETYSKLMQEWLRKVDKIEGSTKRKAKEAKNREFFEKVFPELRKQREDKERFNRVGARVKSEADMEEIMDNLQEQALEDKKMRSYAVIPPILLDSKERKVTYQNDNGFIEDMEMVYKSRQFLNIWTPSEKEIFKEKYLQHPKNFGVIASFIERKSVSDCVQYYYLSKKTENYKQLLRKSRQRTRSSRNNTQKVNSSANTSVVDILTTGVTTRLQREQQQQRTVVQQSREAPGETSASTTAAPTSVPTSTATTTTAPSTASSTPPSTSPSATAAAPSSGGASPSSAGSSATTTAPTTTTAAATVITTTAAGAPVMSTAAAAAASTASAAQPASPKPADNANASVTDTKTGFSDLNSFEDYRSQGGKFFGDDAKGDGSATAADAAHDGVVVTVKKESEPSGQEVASSDQNMTSSTTPAAITESKKKKERRKDKENANVETSDEEATDMPDKSIQGTCIVCAAQLGPHLQSRPLVPSQASQYGLREEQVPANGRVCNTCRCKCVRSRYTHCPLPSCPNSRGRVKRLRSFPQRLQDLPAEVREPLLAEFHVPSGVTKCCSACFNRIQRRLGPVEEWTEDEIGQLKTCLTEVGANWQAVGERLSKPPHQVRAFYAANRKRLNLEGCLGDRKPALTDEEESGSSTSSCEEPMRDRHSSDTASAAESPPVIQNQSQNPIKKEDYDSSATETADEAQTPDHFQGSATITPVTNDGQMRQNQSPLSVKDLVLNVIELQLMKNPGGQVQNPPTSGMAPTISSILNNDSNEVTIVSEYSLNPQRPARSDLSLAKLVTPLIGATITPVPAATHQQQQQQQQQQEQMNSRNDLVVLSVQDSREPETLDLSIKKPREPPPLAHKQHPPQQIHREYLPYHQERKSPFPIRSQPKLPSPKPANPKSGSITLGTPIINQQPRYEGLLRQMTPETKMGSITQGTPIHMPHMQEKRVYDYFNKRGVPQNSPQPGAYPQYRQQSFTVEQQLSSRQIIMNDYITSQQMLGRRNEKAGYYPTSSPHRTPPPVSQQNQQRQGVIQRHTRPYLPPGHEALSSLVDVAVQQPSLPVPNAPHEGLGKTMADNIMEQPHRFQIIQQHQQMRQQQQRMEEQQRRIVYQQQQTRQSRESSTSLTAASLIDAIITHQINQTSEGGREMVTAARETRAGDLLFQGLPALAQQDNNGERPSSVISIDLEAETVNKNLTVKELTDSVISHDFGSRGPNYYHVDNVNEQWKRRLHQQKEDKRAVTPQQDERQIIRIAQPQKYHVEPVSPPDNHWSAEQNFRRYQQPQPQQNQHISPLDYVKNRIVEVMRTEDDKKDAQESQEKERSDSPGEMVIDEEKHEEQQQQQQQGFGFPYVHKESTANDSSRSNEPKPLLSAQYEPLSDED
ncbi:nuclear receptor corepressor 1 isoform X4 [Zophobas morio]|uniref:nuclear receptor corepressor 1 isoform X4 n=1 Tax=Zophobas morio TaxID=2755281 RepID=UPI003083DB59